MSFWKDLVGLQRRGGMLIENEKNIHSLVMKLIEQTKLLVE